MSSNSGTISAICATPPGRNVGMDSVNLALVLFLQRAGLDSRVKYYYPHIQQQESEGNQEQQVAQYVNHGAVTQEFCSAHNSLEQIQGSSAILYWGDFLHMAQYHRTLSRRLIQEGHVKNEHEAAEYIRDIFFLSRAGDAELAKSMAFGGTLIFNSLDDETTGKYASELDRFIKHARKLWVRDVFSHIKLSHLASDYSRIRQGVDCALMIRAKEIESLCGSAETTVQEAVNGKIGVFFGRSKGTGYTLTRFAKRIASGMGKSLYWLPWGDRQGFPSHRTWLMPRPAVPEVMRGTAPLNGTAHLLSALKNSSVIITDTYHVAVNAWNLGTPAICIGNPTPFSVRNVNSGAAFSWRDKRQTFFSMYEALDFFVYAHELIHPLWSRKRIRHILHQLGDQSVVNEIVRRMHQHRDNMETELLSELNDCLN